MLVSLVYVTDGASLNYREHEAHMKGEGRSKRSMNTTSFCMVDMELPPATAANISDLFGRLYQQASDINSDASTVRDILPVSTPRSHIFLYYLLLLLLLL